MSYDFSFDKKAAWALLGGSVVLGVLLFFAGVLVGGNMGEKASAEQAESGKAKDGASGEGETVAGPKVRQAPVVGEPVLMPAPLAPVADAPFAAGPGVAAPGVSAPSMSAPGVAAPRLPPASSVAPPVESYGAEAQRAYPPPRDPDPKLVQEAETGAPGAEEEGPAAPLKGVAYSVQVGDYQEEKSARRLAEELERKGYTPSIFSGRDAENRVWFAVRVGAYAGAKDASQAAANITKQEKLKATVRPINSF
jgi:cell division septation protein DedD